MSRDVDQYLKALKGWKDESSKLREILRETKLDEELKWGKPCFSFDGNNIAIIQPFKDCLGLMLFKGKLIKDPKGVLVDNGPNSQSARRFEFRSVRDVTKLKATIKAYVKQAVALEEAGVKVTVKKKPEAAPPELLQAFAKQPKLKKAFDSLTPGRQRGYILHFLGAKQTATRMSRIDKCAPKILAGKGFHD